MSDIDPQPLRENEASQTRVEYFLKQDLLDPEFSHRKSALQLILEGYGLPLEEGTDPDEQLAIEYEHADGAFLAISEKGEVLGSLSLLDLNQPDERFEPFWSSLGKSSPELRKALMSAGPFFSVRGIVVLQEARNQGVAKKLIKAAEADFSPSGFIGETKTKGAVNLRRNHLPTTFNTFYHNSQVTPSNPEPNTVKHLPIRDAYWSVLPNVVGEYFLGIDESTGIGYVSTEYLNPDVPDVHEEEGILFQAFKPVIDAQIKAGTEKTAVSPLISIKTSVLEASM
jgi:GNAT superfamily N-acetyltransferase